MEGAGAPGTSVGRSTHYNPDRSGPSPFPEETKIEKSFLTATNHAVVNECRSTALVAGHCYRVAVVFSELVTDTFPVFVLAMFPGLSHTSLPPSTLFVCGPCNVPGDACLISDNTTDSIAFCLPYVSQRFHTSPAGSVPGYHPFRDMGMEFVGHVVMCEMVDRLFSNPCRTVNVRHGVHVMSVVFSHKIEWRRGILKVSAKMEVTYIHRQVAATLPPAFPAPGAAPRLILRQHRFFFGLLPEWSS